MRCSSSLYYSDEELVGTFEKIAKSKFFEVPLNEKFGREKMRFFNALISRQNIAIVRTFFDKNATFCNLGICVKLNSEFL